MQNTDARKLAWGFAALTAFTYVLIVLGALVRAHGAGLACPDWPLCFGDVIPRFDFQIAFEWGHRALAGSIALGFVALSVAALRQEAGRSAVSPLISIAAILLVTQILLGALTVWQLLAAWTVTSHLLAGNAFAVCLAFITQRLFEAPGPGDARPGAAAPLLRGAVTAVAALLLLQVILGGLVSSTYAGLACPEWPTCIEGRWFPSFEGALGIHLLHRLGAYALVLALAASAWMARGVPRLGPLLSLGIALCLAQVAVGVANVWLRLPVEVTGLHSLLAAALILTVSLSVNESWTRSQNEC